MILYRRVGRKGDAVVVVNVIDFAAWFAGVRSRASSAERERKKIWAQTKRQRRKVVDKGASRIA
jgi:hypothetical protein